MAYVRPRHDEVASVQSTKGADFDADIALTLPRRGPAVNLAGRSASLFAWWLPELDGVELFARQRSAREVRRDREPLDHRRQRQIALDLARAVERFAVLKREHLARDFGSWGRE